MREGRVFGRQQIVHVDEFCIVVVRAQDREYCMHLLQSVACYGDARCGEDAYFGKLDHQVMI